MEKKKIILNYESPMIEVIEVKVENGFYASGENFDPVYGSWNN